LYDILVTVVEKAGSPGTPPSGERLREIDSGSCTRYCVAESKDDAADDKHGHILGRGL
jgi:hypothetical protein